MGRGGCSPLSVPEGVNSTRYRQLRAQPQEANLPTVEGDQLHALLFFLYELEYSEAALAADPLTVLLAHPFLLLIESWEDIFRKERAGRRQVIRAEALVAVRNVQLDEPSTKLGGLLLVEAGMDRNSPFFTRFFKIAPSLFIRLALRKQCEETLNSMVPELERLPEVSAARTMAPELKERAGNALVAPRSAQPGQGRPGRDLRRGRRVETSCA